MGAELPTLQPESILFLRRMQCVYIFLCLSLCAGGFGSSLLNRQVDFGLHIYSKLAPDSGSDPCKKNLVFSPYGVSSVLGMLQLGASGETLTILTSRMGYSLQETTSFEEQHVLQRALLSEEAIQTVSTILIEQGMVLQKDFLLALDRAFQSTPLPVDFSKPDKALSVANRWISEQTKGTVPSFLQPGTLTEDSRLVLLNSINLKGLWKFPFDLKYTQSRPFLCSDGSYVTVPMMRKIQHFNCGHFSTAGGVEYNVVELPYSHDNLSMILAAPKERHHPLSAVTNELSVHILQGWRAGLKKSRIQLSLPRFKIGLDLDLMHSLSSEGLGDLFNQKNADFSRITTKERLYVSKVLQSVKVEVNEEGTKGSSATAAILFSRMAVEEITLDRSFLFLVQNVPSGAILFMGEVNQLQ